MDREVSGQLKELYSGIESPVFVFTDDGLVVWVNQAALDLVGEGFDDVKQRYLGEWVGPSRESPLPVEFFDKLEALGRISGKATITGSGGEGVQVSYECRSGTPEGFNLGILDPELPELGLDPGRGDERIPGLDSVRLTDREFETLLLLADGAANAQIAAALGISSSTVQQYLDSVRSKFGAASRPELVSRAISEGVIASKSGSEIVIVLRIVEDGRAISGLDVTYVSPGAVRADPAMARLSWERIPVSGDVDRSHDRPLRSSGVVALLCSEVGPDTVIGRLTCTDGAVTSMAVGRDRYLLWIRGGG